MDLILYFIRDTISGTFYFIYASISLICMFAIIGYLLKGKYGKLEIKLATSQSNANSSNSVDPNAKGVINESNTNVLENISNLTGVKLTGENQMLGDVSNTMIQNTNNEFVSNVESEPVIKKQDNITTISNNVVDSTVNDNIKYFEEESFEPTKKINPTPMPSTTEEVISPEPMPATEEPPAAVKIDSDTSKLSESIPELKL
ncbi:MAG: hypothetical protein IJ068_06290 [Bacilli bacterium]|nr:hypothetical protein [Bacilli bacterium]